MTPAGSLPPSPVHTGFVAFRRALPYLVVVVVVGAAVQSVVDTFVLQPRIDELTATLRELTTPPTAGTAADAGPLRDVIDLLLPSVVVAVVVTVLQLAFITRLALSAVDADATVADTTGQAAPPGGFAADVRAALVRLPAFTVWMLGAAAAVYVGLALCILPGLLLTWGFALLPFFVIEKASSPVRGSFRMARAKVVPLVTVAFIGVGGLFLTLVVGQLFAALPFAFGRFGSLAATGLLLAYVMCALAATYRMPAPQRPLPVGMPAPPPPGTQVNPWESIPPPDVAPPGSDRGDDRA